MKQLLQFDGVKSPRVTEVPEPQLKGPGIIVQNRVSLVSAGTERQTIELSRKSILSKALKRPDLVRQVVSKAKTEGIATTYRKVQSRLKKPIALGYSSAGVVRNVHTSAHNWAFGDRVACAGAGYASHAETIFVPTNLAVKIPDTVSDEQAAFVTLGAIAMQGVRVAEPKLGETVVVIGLGLLGQITCMLLEASGCRVLGTDIDRGKLELAHESGAQLTFLADTAAAQILDATAGRGADAVIITAATESSSPVELAGEVCREKGTVSVVGSVKMDVPRKPYYEKELSLKLSRSYGPGRYDYQYEEAGHDYPFGYVRWTENRNMEAFLQLIATNKVNVEPLISHRFDLSDAERAYDLISGRTGEQFMGVLLTYPGGNETVYRRPTGIPAATTGSNPANRSNIGFIGAGNFATGVLLPNLSSIKSCVPVAISSGTGISATSAAETFGFPKAADSADEILGDDGIGTVFIANRHDQHAGLVVKSLTRGKATFVEKPLCLTKEELDRIVRAHDASGAPLMVGFNRRFAPAVEKIKQRLADVKHPLSMHYRINAGFIPPDNWVQDPYLGGGRIIGEVCHFVDLLSFVSGSQPFKVYAEALSTSGSRYRSDDNLQITIRFTNGSVGTINYVACGSPRMSKEYLEIFGGGMAITMDNYKVLTVADDKGLKITKSRTQDKGHRNMLEHWIQAVTDNRPSPIPFEHLISSTLTTFAILDCLNTGETQWLAP